MDVMEAVRSRRSVRKFTGEEISPEEEAKLKEALLWAPSAGNLQSRKYYFVKDRELKARLASAALGQGFIALAPLVVVGCSDKRISTRYGERGVELYMIQDVAAGIMSMMLAAASEGLGTVWVGAFHEAVVTEVLQLPEHLRPVAIVPVGHPAKIPSPPPRMSMEEAIVEL